MKVYVSKSMRALIQSEIGGELRLREIPVPHLQSGEVLIKMAYSPINPSDLSQLKGTFHGVPDFPFVPGIEGSGLVVAAGKGLLPKLRMGKRVSCTASKLGNGTWAEYLVTSATHCIPIPNGISLENGAMGIVNPMTALGFIDVVKSGRHKAFVNNAAASALGKMVIGLAKMNKLPLINIVRRKEQVPLLKELGAENVLCSSDVDYAKQLRNICQELSATLFFDAIGGEQTAILVKASPRKSTIVLYSNLSGEPITVSPRIILQEDKVIKGFSLSSYTSEKSLIQMLLITRRMAKLSKTTLKSTVQKQFAIDEGNLALAFYKENMTKGKVLLKF